MVNKPEPVPNENPGYAVGEGRSRDTATLCANVSMSFDTRRVAIYALTLQRRAPALSPSHVTWVNHRPANTAYIIARAWASYYSSGNIHSNRMNKKRDELK